MIKDKVSIIIPVYNAEKFIGKTIESVQAQTYKNWEIVIMNDKSTDRSYEIIKKMNGYNNETPGLGEHKIVSKK